MYLYYEGNRKGDISPSWGQPEKKNDRHETLFPSTIFFGQLKKTLFYLKKNKEILTYFGEDACLVGLNSDLYRLCGSLHGLDTC